MFQSTHEKSHYYTPPRLYEVLQEKQTPKTSCYSRRHGSKKGNHYSTNQENIKHRSKIRVSYDQLLLATECHSFVPPQKVRSKLSVLTLRTIKDALRIREFARKH